MILWYAGAPARRRLDSGEPVRGRRRSTLFDYNAYWVEDVYDYVLYTGDLALARQVWPNLVRLMDSWYPAQIGPERAARQRARRRSTTRTSRGRARRSPTTTPATCGRSARPRRSRPGSASRAEAAAWTARIAPIAAAFGPAFWDASVGAYRDATAGPVVHPEDGNVFAVLAGLAPPAQARSALDYLGGHDWQPYGAAIADNDVWDGYPVGRPREQARLPVHLVLRGARPLPDRASTPRRSALIRREWGYMLDERAEVDDVGDDRRLRRPARRPDARRATTAGRAARRRR